MFPWSSILVKFAKVIYFCIFFKDHSPFELCNFQEPQNLECPLLNTCICFPSFDKQQDQVFHLLWEACGNIWGHCDFARLSPSAIPQFYFSLKDYRLTQSMVPSSLVKPTHSFGRAITMVGTFLGWKTLPWQPAMLDTFHKFRKKVFPAFFLPANNSWKWLQLSPSGGNKTGDYFFLYNTCVTDLWNQQFLLLNLILEEAEKNYSISMQKNDLNLFYLLQKIVLVIKNSWEESLSAQLIIFSYWLSLRLKPGSNEA